MMTGRYTCLTMVLAAMLAAGCNSMGGQPDFERAAISPSQLMPGDMALITIEPNDKDGIIHRIEGIVQEDPRQPLELNDEGVDGDEIAGDGVWSLGVDVPALALGGSYTVEFTAYRRDGTPVPIRDKEGNVTPLSTVITIQINAAAPPAETPVE